MTCAYLQEWDMMNTSLGRHQLLGLWGNTHACITNELLYTQIHTGIILQKVDDVQCHSARSQVPFQRVEGLLPLNERDTFHLQSAIMLMQLVWIKTSCEGILHSSPRGYPRFLSWFHQPQSTCLLTRTQQGSRKWIPEATQRVLYNWHCTNSAC